MPRLAEGQSHGIEGYQALYNTIRTTEWVYSPTGSGMGDIMTDHMWVVLVIIVICSIGIMWELILC